MNINDILKQFRQHSTPFDRKSFDDNFHKFREEFEAKLKEEGHDAEVKYTQPRMQQFQSPTGAQPLVDVEIYNKKTRRETLYSILVDSQGLYWEHVVAY